LGIMGVRLHPARPGPQEPSGRLVAVRCRWNPEQGQRRL